MRRQYTERQIAEARRYSEADYQEVKRGLYSNPALENLTDVLLDKFGVQCRMRERAMWKPIAKAAILVLRPEETAE